MSRCRRGRGRWRSSRRYLPAWLFVGTATWCIARAFDGTVAWIDVVPAAVLSWIVGFVLVPIPGGLGVREAAFVGLATALPSGIAATVAIAARLSFMLVDGLGAVIAGITLRGTRHHATPVDSSRHTSGAGGGAITRRRRAGIAWLDGRASAGLRDPSGIQRGRKPAQGDTRAGGGPRPAVRALGDPRRR